MTKIKVSSIWKRFGGDFLNMNPDNSSREISIPSFSRMGLELTGVFLKNEILSVICWGEKESVFLNQLDDTRRENTLGAILGKNPPIFLLSKHFQHTDLLIELNGKINDNRSAIIKLNYTTVEIFSLIGTWISKKMSVWTTIHGTVLNIYGEGVLITGEPGIGKSETASELMKMNHLFLGDDAINVTRIGNAVIARAHPLSEGFIHIRGLGILNIKEIYGGMRLIDETKISIIIELKKADNNELFENVGDEIHYKPLLDIKIPYYSLPVTSGRKVSELIELAVVDMKTKKFGYNAAIELNKKYKQFIKS